MSSPRKFSEKIALLQQKQVEGDAAFNTILNEVEAAKQKAERRSSLKGKLEVPKRKYEVTNGLTNYPNQSIKLESNNNFDRLSLPSDNLTWRRTYSDSSIPQSLQPNGNCHQPIAHDDNDQSYNFNSKLDPPPPYTAHHYIPNNCQYQQVNQFDFNNNNCINDRTNLFHQSINETHFQNGNTSSNVLMLPPHQYPRGGGSLPDLRFDHHFSNDSQHYFRTLSPQQNSNGDSYMLEPQQQLPSTAGPLKQTPNMRRRHSPIGDVRSRRHSPSPDCSPGRRNVHRIEPQSPQSQSSYSPQNSPHLLSSPANELSSVDNSQQYVNLSTNFDQINLDNNFFQNQPQSSSPSLPATPASVNHFSPFMDDLTVPYRYSPSTNSNVKSPTIPDIILTDVDNSKTTDFSNTIDNFMTENDFQLTADDLMLNGLDLASDMNIADSGFNLER